MTAEESFAEQAERHTGTFQWEDGDPVEYNCRTWLTGTCKDNGGTYTYLFTDVDTGSVYIMIRNVDLHKKEAETLLNSIESQTTSRRPSPRPAASRFRASRSSSKGSRTPARTPH